MRSNINYILNELALRVIYIIITSIITALVCYIYAYELLYILIKPLNAIITENTKQNIQFIFTDLTESFKSHVYISIYISIQITILYSCIQVFLFMIPGLFEKEYNKYKMYLFIFFIGTTIQIYVIQTKIIPIIWHFLLSFEYKQEFQIINIQLQAKILNFIILNTNLLINFTTIFIIGFICAIYINRLENKQQLNYINKYRKYVYILNLILAAIISPPDIISQIAFSLPIFLYFECFVIFKIIKKIYKKKLGEDRIRTCDRIL